LIFSLQINDNVSFNINEITDHILDYFKTLLGTTDDRILSLDRHLWNESEKLSDESRLILEQPISLEEIKTVVYECNGHKASDPDGIFFSSNILKFGVSGYIFFSASILQ
jgi:hypothetical protein